jgi:hypothetical protein
MVAKSHLLRRRRTGTGTKKCRGGRGPGSELRRRQGESPASPFVLVSERGGPLSAAGLSRIVDLVITRTHAAPRPRL